MGCSASSPVAKESPSLKLQTSDFLIEYEKGQHWICDKYQDVKPKRAKQGVAAKDNKIIHDFFAAAAKKHSKTTALRVERTKDGMPPADGKQTDGVSWKKWTWAEYYEDCMMAGKAFRALGLKDRDAVCIFGFNSPEWMMSQLGCTLAGGITAGIYPSDNAEQVKFKAHHSGSVIASCQEAKQVNTFIKIAKDGGLPKLRAIVYWFPKQDVVSSFENSDGVKVEVVHWSALDSWAQKTSADEMEEVKKRTTSGTCSQLVYTSGTTGDPKAVMLSHDNVIFECHTVLHSILQDEPATFQAVRAKGEPVRLLSYLPLSHVAGALVDIISPVVSTAEIIPMTISYARASDLKEGTLKDRLASVRPSVFLGVPRVWEKIQEGVLAKRAENPPGAVAQSIINSAKEGGQLYANNRQMGGNGQSSGCHCLWQKMVYSKLRGALGLDECFFAMSGAAPIQRATVDFFAQLGLYINDVYGMSESSAAVTVSSDYAHLAGSCGYALRGTEVAILREEPEGSKNYVKAEPCPSNLFNNAGIDEKYQGEICFRGRQIMMGYMANPDLGEEHVEQIRKKNAEAIDENGWLHSGDKGLVDKRGMFRITGRYKELIITAGGENVAPVPIEDAIKQALGGQGGVVSNIMMIGDKRKFNICILTLTCEGATGEKPGSDKLAGGAKKATSASTIKEAIKDEKFIEKITAAITSVNKNGKVCPSNASKIQKFSILPLDFSVETGEFTATLKLKRKVVEEKYHDLIERVYSSDATFVPYEGN